MDDIGSLVVGQAHDVGQWHGPSQRAWLLRIAHGAGFGRQWELNQLAEEPASESGSQRLEPPGVGIVSPTDASEAAESLRMWWLPSSKDI
jgi:hypothetical protein